VRTGESMLGQFRLVKVRACYARLGQVGLFRPGKARLDQVMSGYVWSFQVRSGLVRLYQFSSL
jgi:hypothetical protein